MQHATSISAEEQAFQQAAYGPTKPTEGEPKLVFCIIILDTCILHSVLLCILLGHVLINYSPVFSMYHNGDVTHYWK